MKTQSRNERRWKVIPAKAKAKFPTKTRSLKTNNNLPDLEDPFLCTECQKLGYCRRFREEREKTEEAAERKRASFVMEDAAIRNLVPLDAKNVKGKYSRQHLVVAYEAIHQKDFETAILHLMAVLESGEERDAAQLALAVSHYFLKNYAKALEHASQYEERYYSRSNKMQDFIVHCANSLKKQQAEAQQKQEQEEKEAEQAVKQLLSEKKKAAPNTILKTSKALNY